MISSAAPPAAVVVHGLGHVRAALRAGSGVLLLSAPGAALFAGAAWWLALMAAARAIGPDVMCGDLLDCADAPGRAMEALRLGQRGLVLDPRCPAFPAVAAAAASLGGVVHRGRPAALDLAEPGAERHLDRWLRGDSAGWRG